MKLGSSIKEIEREEGSDTIQFGKYRGTKLTELDVKYIMFLLTKCDWIDESLRNKLEIIMESKKRELPCFGFMYDPSSRTCGACAFLEDCVMEYGY